jgi:nicotinamidase-related amidase
MPTAKPTPGKMLLSPTDHTLVLIDFQSQMAFATKSIDPVVLRNNAGLVANAAKIFNVPTIPTTVAEKTFSGPMFDEIRAAFPKTKFLDRTSMNPWEDKAVIEKVNQIGKGRIVLAGLWTSVCIAGPALSALDQGFEVYVVADGCGDVSNEAHERAKDPNFATGSNGLIAVDKIAAALKPRSRVEPFRAHGG